MVTQPSDYEEMLWQLQSDAPTGQAILLPKDEKIFDVDLNLRTIDVPEFLSVEKDHQAETIYFKFDRYYENIDLTTKTCIIQYINANGDSFIYPVPFYDTETFGFDGKVIIPWCIQGAATAAAGMVKFAIRFYSINIDRKIEYNLNTLVAQGQVLKGQEGDFEDFDESSITLDNSLLELIQELEQAKNDNILALYWVDV